MEDVVNMQKQERSEKLIELLNQNTEPMSGGELAKILGVSRQVIVQDIALLRAINKNILSTTKGYVLYTQEQQKIHCNFLVKHTTDQILDELCTIVDHGGKVLDVIVEHEIYGVISTDLIISSRQDVYDFVEKIKTNKSTPLKELANDIHMHTVEADSQEILDRIEKALIEKKYLLNKE